MPKCSMSAVTNGLVVVGLCLGGAGCAQESRETGAEAGDEDVAAAQQAVQTPVCVTVRRGVLGNVTDTFLSGDYPFWAPGGESSLWTGKSGGGNENRALIRFDLSFLPPTAKVTSATLMVLVSWNDQNNLVYVHRVLAPWSEATATAANFGAPGNYAPSPETGFLAGDVGFKSADVTELARGWVSGAIPNHGVALVEPPVRTHLFWSSEASLSARPALGLCYVNGPAPHRGGALVAGGVTSDSPSHHFIGTLGESPGGNRVSVSSNHRFIGGVVGATQE